MSYEKHTWETGEVITAEKLNHIESGIEDAPGYECTETKTVLDLESVTTVESSGFNVAQLSYSALFTQDVLIVTFDGVEYVCNKIELETGVGYGGFSEEQGPDFTDYPFFIVSYDSSGTYTNDIYTENVGTHSIKIEEVSEVVTTTPCFKKAVDSVVDVFLFVGMTITGEQTFTLDKTWQEIYDAMDSGRLALIKSEFSSSPLTGISHAQIHSCQYNSSQNEYQVYFGSQNTAASSSSPDGVLSGYYGG